MSTTNRLLADGSAAVDSHEPVRMNVDEKSWKWRFRCPNGHRDWYPTNSHVWCKGCRRQLENGETQIDAAEHWELVDNTTGQTVPWSAVILEDSNGNQIS